MKNIKVKNYQEQTAAFVLLLFVLALLPAAALASPAWSGQEGATVEQWTFSEMDYGPVNPDTGWDNDYGMPQLYVSSAQWDSSFDQRQGVWTLMGFMGGLTIDIPNNPVLQPEKIMWIELTWKGANLSILPDQPAVAVSPLYNGSDNEFSMEMIRQDTPPDMSGWFTSLFMVNILPNPSSEWVIISGDIRIDKVVIDTICIPEPATMTLLGLGIALGLRRKRNV